MRNFMAYSCPYTARGVVPVRFLSVPRNLSRLGLFTEGKEVQYFFRRRGATVHELILNDQRIGERSDNGSRFRYLYDLHLL